MTLHISVLGTVSATRDGSPLSLGGPMQRGVVALLALASPEDVSIDRLAEALWGADAPPSAATTVRVYISRLRGILGADHLHKGPAGYGLTGAEVDARELDARAAAGHAALRAGDIDEAATALAEALALWRGPALADLAHLPFAGPAAAALDATRTEVTEALVAARLARGEDRDVLPTIRAVVEAQPARERANALLMLALYRAGRQAEALAVYTALRRHLVDSLGIEPDATTRDVHARLLAQDPLLLDPAASLKVVGAPRLESATQDGSNRGGPGGAPAASWTALAPEAPYEAAGPDPGALIGVSGADPGAPTAAGAGPQARSAGAHTDAKAPIAPSAGSPALAGHAPEHPDVATGGGPLAFPRPGPAAPPPARAGLRPPVLPVPLTAFIGRRKELETARSLVDAARLVTLTGSGGCGKTRLALELARASAHERAWFVELAGLSDGTFLPGAIAAALGLGGDGAGDPEEQLVEALAPLGPLLFLDNCEHVVEEAAVLVERLLQRCPGLRVVATSREPLGVPGERVLVVPSLEVTAEEGTPEAVLLFAERAAQVVPGFALTAANRPLVARICRELDGVPLAIELAAARLPVLSLEQIAGMLDDRFSLLTTGARVAVPRHRTLGAAISWSYELLEDDERRLFTALSVFRGGFPLEALRPVVGADASIDVLGRLVAKSMLTADTSGAAPRYSLLETLREFGAQRLAPEQRTALADAHAQWCRVLVEELATRYRTPGDTGWWGHMVREQHNFRAALRHALGTGQHDLALGIASTMSWCWYRHGPVTEGLRTLDAALADGAGSPGPRAHALVGRALLRSVIGDLKAARSDLRAAEALVSGEGDGGPSDLVILAIARVYLAYFEAVSGETAAATRWLARAQEMPEEVLAATGPQVLLARALLAIGAGRRAEAERLLAEGRRLSLEVGHRWAALICGWILAKVRLDAGRPAEAAVLLRGVVQGLAEQSDRTSLLVVLPTMAAAVAALGRSEDGAAMLGAVDALAERSGFSALGMDPVDGPRHRASVTRRLSPQAAAAARDRGRGLSLREAVELALRAAAAVVPQPA